MYEELRHEIERQWQEAKQQHRSGEELILGKILFNLPENRPQEALVNMTRLVQSTQEADVQERYTEVLRQIAKIVEEK